MILPAAATAVAPHLTPLAAPFAVTGVGAAPLLDTLAQLADAFRRAGHPQAQPGDPATRIVLNVADPATPRAFHRVAAGQFVVSVLCAPSAETPPLAFGYPYLVRTLANLCLVLLPAAGGCAVHAITLERGAYCIGEGLQGPTLAAAVYRHLRPLALSNLMIGNRFSSDLPREFEAGTAETRALARAGRWLAQQDLLAAPFPIADLLSPDDLRHVQLLFGLGALSYGNLSARHDATSFWMSSSGVDKRALNVVGQDLALVTGLDLEAGALTVSVPALVRRPRHVSVDAIEHYMIYREHPQVGAVVHLHAWMADAPVTTVNYPCDTYELAAEVAGLLRTASDPSRAVIGLKNHGVTLTGHDVDDILRRIDGRLLRQVPPLP